MTTASVLQLKALPLYAHKCHHLRTSLPLKKGELPPLMYNNCGVKITGECNSGGRVFRLVNHIGVGDDGISVSAVIEGTTSLWV